MLEKLRKDKPLAEIVADQIMGFIEQEQLEPQIAEVATLTATDKEIREMKKLCDEVEGLILSGINHIDKDIELHTQIAKSSKNLIVSKILPTINDSSPIFIDVTKSALKMRRLLHIGL